MRFRMIWIQIGIVFCLWNTIETQVTFGQSKGSDVRIVSLGDEELAGTIESISTERIAVNVKGVSKARSAAEVNRVEFSNRLAKSHDAMELTLIDGTRLYGTKLLGKDSGWFLADSAGGNLDLGNASVKSLMVRSLTPDLLELWNTFLKESSQTDALIVLRPGNVLDRVNGMISEVKDSKVVFDLDGQTVEVPFEKLAGMIWYRKATERIKPTIEVKTTDHSVWYAESLSSNATVLELKPFFGKTVSVPFSKLVALDYSHANLKWLYEIEAIERVAEKRVDWKPEVAAVQKMLAPRFTLSARVDGGQAGGSDYDLVFPGPGRFVFRVPEGYAKLQSTVERIDTGSRRSDLSLLVTVDDTIVWQGKLASNQESILVDAPVVPGKKVKLSVVCDGKLMVGTSVSWTQPRLRR